MEQGHDSTFEFGTTTDIHSSRRKGLPDYWLTDVGGDEKIDTWAKTVSFLEEFIKENNNKCCNDKLDDKEEADAGADVFGLAVESGENVDGSLSKRNDEGKN